MLLSLRYNDITCKPNRLYTYNTSLYIFQFVTGSMFGNCFISPTPMMFLSRSFLNRNIVFNIEGKATKCQQETHHILSGCILASSPSSFMVIPKKVFNVTTDIPIPYLVFSYSEGLCQLIISMKLWPRPAYFTKSIHFLFLTIYFLANFFCIPFLFYATLNLSPS